MLKCAMLPDNPQQSDSLAASSLLCDTLPAGGVISLGTKAGEQSSKLNGAPRTPPTPRAAR